jgi:hypothetical protein
MIKARALISKKQCFTVKTIPFNVILYSLDNYINDIIVFNLKLKMKMNHFKIIFVIII